MITMFKNILKQLVRKKSSFFTIFVFPILIGLLTFALETGNTSIIKIGIIDRDNTKISQLFFDSLMKYEKYRFYKNLDEKLINEYIANGDFTSVLIIDKGFEDSVLEGKSKKAELRSQNNSNVSMWLSNQVNYLIDNFNTMGEASHGDISIFEKILAKNKELKYDVHEKLIEDRSVSNSILSSSSGMLLLLMIVTSSFLYTMIIEEKSTNIFNRISLTRLSTISYVLAYTFIGLIYYFVQICIVLIVLKILNISFFINTAYLILLLMLFGLVCTTFGLLIGSISKTELQCVQIMNTIALPTSMIAGCLWPFDLMPSFMKAIGECLPQRWVLKSIHKLQNGSSLFGVHPYLFGLIFLSVMFFIFTIKKLNKKFN